MKNYKNTHYWREKCYNFEEYYYVKENFDKKDFIKYLKENARQIKYHRNVKEIEYLIIHEKECDLLYLLQNAKKIVIIINVEENNKTKKIIKKLLKINPDVDIIFEDIYFTQYNYNILRIMSGMSGIVFSN